MNKLFNVTLAVAAAMVFGISGAYAQTQVMGNGFGNTTAGSQSSAGATGVAAGNNTDTTVISNAAPIPSNTQIKMAPAITAPGLTTTLTETCLGSISGGVSILGGGITGGSTVRDSRCGNRLDAREIRGWGENDVAKEIMCGTEEVRAAYKRVGRPCIEDQNQKQADASTGGKKIGTGTKDEYVRSSK